MNPQNFDQFHAELERVQKKAATSEVFSEEELELLFFAELFQKVSRLDQGYK